jgi:hypothetical protein
MNDADNIFLREKIATIETDVKYLRQSFERYEDKRSHECDVCKEEIWDKLSWLECNQYKAIGAIGLIQFIILIVGQVLITNFLL